MRSSVPSTPVVAAHVTALAAAMTRNFLAAASNLNLRCGLELVWDKILSAGKEARAFGALLGYSEVDFGGVRTGDEMARVRASLNNRSC